MIKRRAEHTGGKSVSREGMRRAIVGGVRGWAIRGDGGRGEMRELGWRHPRGARW